VWAVGRGGKRGSFKVVIALGVDVVYPGVKALLTESRKLTAGGAYSTHGGKNQIPGGITKKGAGAHEEKRENLYNLGKTGKISHRLKNPTGKKDLPGGFTREGKISRTAGGFRSWHLNRRARKVKIQGKGRTRAGSKKRRMLSGGGGSKNCGRGSKGGRGWVRDLGRAGKNGLVKLHLKSNHTKPSSERGSSFARGEEGGGGGLRLGGMRFDILKNKSKKSNRSRPQLSEAGWRKLEFWK